MEQIKDYENYTLKFDGTVTNIKGDTIKQHQNGSGYQRIVLYKNGKIRRFFIHRLIAEHFIANSSNLPEVDHIDGNKLNNSIQNLRWSTRSSNNHNKTKSKGYYLDKVTKTYYTQIKIDGKKIYLGRFINESDARAAYLEASKTYFPGIKQ